MSVNARNHIKKTLRPDRLDITDMPRDSKMALGGLRRSLCMSFNYCRKYPVKLQKLKEVLKYTYNRIVEIEKSQLEKKTLGRLDAKGKGANSHD